MPRTYRFNHVVGNELVSKKFGGLLAQRDLLAHRLLYVEHVREYAHRDALAHERPQLARALAPPAAFVRHRSGRSALVLMPETINH